MGPDETGPAGEGTVRRIAHRVALELDRRWDRWRRARHAGEAPQNLRIVPYLGHGGDEAVVRGRVVDDPEPSAAAEGEDTWAAIRRTATRFRTDELPGVALRIRIGDTTVETITDDEGYFDIRVPAHLGDADAPWKEATVELAAPFRGVTAPHITAARVRVPASGARFAVISDVDDTILHTGAQRMWRMVRTTLTGSALTRTPFAGAPELYRALAGGPDAPDTNPFFYVSSSPWNLHGFLTAFLEHRDFPLGPLLLRDLGVDETKFIKSGHGTHKLARISEVLELHPDLEVVLVGDSGQRDPRIYAEVVRRFPDRVRAVYIREVRLDPGDGRVEAITDGWDHDVPFVLAADSTAVAQHAADLGLLDAADVRAVEQAVAAAAPASTGR